jgi:hypothetical protein
VSEVEWAPRWNLTKGSGQALPGMALADWRRWASSEDRRNGTREGDGTVPDSQGERGASYGERIGQGEVGRIGERMPNARTPGVRQRVDLQSTLEREHLKHNKGGGLLGSLKGAQRRPVAR